MLILSDNRIEAAHNNSLHSLSDFIPTANGALGSHITNINVSIIQSGIIPDGNKKRCKVCFRRHDVSRCASHESDKGTTWIRRMLLNMMQWISKVNLILNVSQQTPLPASPK